jgi:DNA-binding MarR family transcriptional regulator
VPDRSQLQLSDYLPYLINRVGAALATRYVDEKLAATGLGIADWRVLLALLNDGACRQVDLAEQTSVDVSTLSRLIARLVRTGLVTRERAPHNNREVLVELTAKGRAMVEQLIPYSRQLEDIAVAGIDPRDLDIMRRILRQMYGNLMRPAAAAQPEDAGRKVARKSR